MELFDEIKTKFERWIDKRLFRLNMNQARFEDLVASGKSPEEAIKAIETDIDAGKTGWTPVTKGGPKKRR